MEQIWNIQGEYVMGTDLKNKVDKHKPSFEYEILPRLIGKGNDRVYKGIRKDTKEAIAVKKTLLRSENHFEKCVDGYLKIADLAHPNIIKHLGMELDLDDRDGPCFVLLMEYCPGGNLFQRSCSLPYLTSDQIKHYARQIINGLLYLYENGVCHLDLKGANILLAGEELDTLKICDFGEVVGLKSALQTRPSEIPLGPLGTATHMSPELIDEKNEFRRGRAADVYSFGCILIEMMSGKSPEYKRGNTVLWRSHQIYDFVANGGGPVVPQTPLDLFQLVVQCIHRDPTQRISAAEIVQSSCLECTALMPVGPYCEQEGFHSTKAEVAIGIDLGNAVSCAAVFRNGKAEAIVNSNGRRLTPSCVTFHDNLIIVGEGYYENAFLNRTNTVFCVKEIIGRSFRDPEVQIFMDNMYFRTIDRDGLPIIEVDVNNESTTYTPSDISSLVLQSLRETAEEFIGTPVAKAVIAVPESFTDAQRKATRLAGEKAGLEVISFISEPTAAALSYNMHRLGHDQRILVFNLGEYDFGLASLKVTNGAMGQFDVVANESRYVGGKDFTEVLIDHFIRELKRLNPGLDLCDDPSSLDRLEISCYNLKKRLSTQNSVAILELDFMYNGKKKFVGRTKITLAEYESLSEDLFSGIRKELENLLQQASLDPSDIQHVLMIGCKDIRMRKMKELLSNFFPGAAITLDMKADSAIARGAAIYANSLLPKPINLWFAVHVKILGGHLQIVIPRDTTIPAAATHTYSTAWDNQTTVHIEVYKVDAHRSHLLGTLWMKDIAPARAGTPRIIVHFLCQRLGVLDVTARDEQSGRTVTCSLNCLEDQIYEKSY